MAQADWDRTSDGQKSDWGGLSSNPANYTGVSANSKNWVKNKQDYLDGTVTITYNQSDLTYNDLNTFYNGYDPATVTPVDIHSADYSPVSATSADWSKL